jgi:hypothetical protein
MDLLSERQSIILEVVAQVSVVVYFVAIYPYGQLLSLDSFQPLLYGLGIGAAVGIGYILLDGRQPCPGSSLDTLGAFLLLIVIGVLRDVFPLVTPILIVTPILVILIARGPNYFRLIFHSEAS